MENDDFDKLYNNLNLELSKFLLKIKTCLSLNTDIEDLAKEKCRKWVAKLSDVQDLNVSTINNHISYAKIILDMLLKNHLGEQFLKDPPESILPPAADYTITTDLEAVFNDELDRYFAFNSLSNQNSNVFHHDESSQMKTESGFKLEQLNSILTAKQKELENMFIKSEDPMTLKRKTIGKLQNKIFMMKERIREELLSMEKIHELKVKQIISRKNASVAEQAEKYERKLYELEAEKNRLDKKYQLEVKNLLESKEKEISEIKGCHEIELKSKESAITDQLTIGFKEESHHMARKHAQEIEKLYNDMRDKLSDTRECHNNEMFEKLRQLEELGKRLESTMAILGKVEIEKKEQENSNAFLKMDLEKLKDEAELFKNNLLSKDSEMKHMESDHKLEMKTLKYQSDAVEESLKMKYFSSTAKLTERICHLQKLLKSKENQLCLLKKEEISSGKLLEKVDELKKLLESKEEEIRTITDERSSQIKDLIQKHSVHIEEIECMHRKEVERICTAFEEKIKSHEKIENSLKDELSKQNGAFTATKKNLEEKVEQAKKQERKLCKEHDELLIKMTNLEKDLASARAARSKLEQNQSQKLKKLNDDFHEKILHETQKFNAEKKELLKNTEMLRGNFQKEKQLLSEKHKSAISEMESKYNHRTECDLKIKELLESRIEQIEQEKQDSIELSKRELKELEKKKEEEIQAFQIQFQAELKVMHNKLYSTREVMKEQHNKKIRTLSEQHSLKMSRLQMKCKSKILEGEKALEKVNSELQSLRQKNIKQEVNFNERLLLMTNQFQGEADRLKEELERSDVKISDLQKQLSQKDELLKECQIHYVEQISLLRTEHLKKLRTMVPSSVKKDLEDAIEALRSQISSLKERLDSREREREKHDAQWLI